MIFSSYLVERAAIVRALSIVILFCLPSPALATIFIHPSLIYLQSATEQGGSTVSERRVLYDIAAGYAIDQGWMVGLLYGTEKTRMSSGSGDSDVIRTSLGPSIGWMAGKDNSGPYVRGHYFFMSEYESGTTRYNGTGYQVDLGFRIPVQRASISLQLSYKFFEYKKYNAGGTTIELGAPLRHTYIDPMVGLFIGF